jgi:hypothetical protein
MGLLDPVFRFFGDVSNRFDNLVEAITNPQVGDQQASDALGGALEDTTPADEVAAVIVDLVEEGIIDDLEDEGEITPENVEAIADSTEGAATSVLLGLGLAGSAIEASSLGQVDQHQEYITQAVAALGVGDVTGTELEARLEEGIKPAQEARVGKEHRAKFVNLQDAVEYALRNKENDTSWLTGSGAPADVVDKIGSNEPVNPENLVEEWGIRDDQLDILEAVALQQIEFEELLETPAELGKVVPPEVLEAELDRAGYAEETKEFLQETAEVLPESARTYQELLRTEELVRSLDTLAQDGIGSPEAALETIPDQVEADDQAFIDRFQLLRDLPAGSPSGADFEKSFHQGYIDLAALRDRLDQTEYPTGDFEAVLRTVVRDEIDGDLQESLALGLISEAQYGEYMDFVGLDAETQAALVAGQDLGDVADSRLQEAAPAGDRPVSAIPGIGQSRSTALEAVGIETFGDLAGADPETVAQAAQVSPETAQEFIDLAVQASG